MIKKKKLEREDKPLYYLMLASAIIFILQSIFIPVLILNVPIRHIFISVLILILVTIFLTRNRLLFSGQSSKDKIKTRILVIGFNSFKYFVAFGIVYYIFLTVAFNIYVKKIGSLGSTEFYNIPITQINKASTSGGPSIDFYFKEKYNSISGRQFYEILNNTEDRFHPNRKLRIECRKSIFNSYLVDSYEIR